MNKEGSAAAAKASARINWGNVATLVIFATVASFSTAYVLNPNAAMGTLWLLVSGKWDVLIGLVGSIAGTYFGARYAFKLQADKEQRKEREREYSGAVQVFVTLTNMVTRLASIKVNIHGRRRWHMRHLRIQPTHRVSDEGLKVDPADLAFLTRAGDEDANFIGEVVVAAWGFKSALDTLNHRSEVFNEQVKPHGIAYANAHPELPGYVTSEFFDSIPAATDLEMRMATDQMFNAFDAEIARLTDIANQLGVKIKQHFSDLSSKKFAMSIPDVFVDEPDGPHLHLRPTQVDTAPHITVTTAFDANHGRWSQMKPQAEA